LSELLLRLAQPFPWHVLRLFTQIQYFVTEWLTTQSAPRTPISNVRATSRGVLVRIVGVECARQSYLFLQ
jgi:hypothetical protein